MKIVKPLQIGLMSRTFSKDKRFFLSIATLAYFPFHNSTALGMEQEMWETIISSLGQETVFDLCMPKVKGEVLMIGNCFAPKKEPTKQLYVDLKMGSILKRLLVTGDRFWKRGDFSQGILGRLVDGEWEPTEPIPFTEMNIGWENTFGGDGFAHNPLGKGYIPKGEEPFADQSSPLPNIERIDSLILEPQYHAIPGNYGPVDLSWPARANKLGKKYDKDWEKNRYPEPAVDMIPTYYNAAPPDQMLKNGFWDYGEEFFITNMHTDEPTLHSNLPKIRPRAFVLQREEEKERWNEVALTPETVWLFPNIKRGILISRGVYETDTFYGVDVDTLLLAWELQEGRTRGPKDYRQSIKLREDDDTSEQWLLRQDDLSPPEGIPEEPDMFADPDADDPAELYGPAFQQAKETAEKQVEQAKKIALAVGADPNLVASKIQIPDPKILEVPKLNKMSDIPDLLMFFDQEHTKAASEMSKLEKSTVFFTKDKDETIKRVNTKAKEIAQRCGHDWDELKTIREKDPANKLTPMQNLTKGMENAKIKLKDHPDKISEIDKALGKLKSAESQVEELMEHPEFKSFKRNSAHYEDPPELPNAETSQNLRIWVCKKYKEDADFQNAELNGVDLSGLNLSEANFAGASLDSVNFSNTDLSKAKFTQAILARANFTKSKLTNTTFDDATLGKAIFHYADLSKASLKNTVLAQTDFSNAVMVNAKIEIGDCNQTDFSDANLTKTFFASANIIECKFNNTNCQDSNFHKSTFMESNISKSNFSNAKLNDTCFVEVEASYVNFTNASMENTNAHEESNFSYAQFNDVRGEGLNFANSNLSNANFENATMKDASFGESTLANANFLRAIATETEFTDADLRGANFTEANLMESSFQGALLSECDFTNSNLFGTDFSYSQRRNVDFFGAIKKRSSLKDD